MAQSPPHLRSHRLEFRVTEEEDALIRQAADLEDSTMSAFVLETVTARANRVLKRHQDVVMSSKAFDLFISELDKSAKPVKKLVKLFKDNPKLPQR